MVQYGHIAAHGAPIAYHGVNVYVHVFAIRTRVLILKCYVTTYVRGTSRVRTYVHQKVVT